MSYSSTTSTAAYTVDDALIVPHDGSSTDSSAVHSLAALWAKRYVKSLATPLSQTLQTDSSTRAWSRDRIAAQLQQSLNRSTAQAWSQTEALLSEEIERHRVASTLIDPWQISADTHHLYQQAIQAYIDQVAPQRLSVIVGPACGAMRQKYTAQDPRVIGFVSMQFHYTGQQLLKGLPAQAQVPLEAYFKVLDDHMYMPLQSAYQAAARCAFDSPALRAVQSLLPLSTQIAHVVCDRVSRSYPHYRSYSGLLNARSVRASSIRDVEMFQVYLCLCALEQHIGSIQQELFPLCVMLYPRLQVKWRLVQEMLHTLGWEMHDRLGADGVSAFLPYLKTLVDMFSIDLLMEEPMA